VELHVRGEFIHMLPLGRAHKHNHQPHVEVADAGDLLIGVEGEEELRSF
jgi:hypothetical protein